MLNLFAVSASYSGLPAMMILLLFPLILAVVLALFLSPFMIVTAVLRAQAEKLLNRKDATVIAQYDPPYGLTPAEIGLLYDLKCDDKEIRATLFNLAERGIVQLDSAQKVTVLDQQKYQSLQQYEKIAIRMFDKDATSLDPESTVPVTITAADGATQQIDVQLPPAKFKVQFTHEVQKSLAQKGIRMRGYISSFILRMLALSFAIGLWPLASGSRRSALDHKWPAACRVVGAVSIGRC